MLRKPAQACCSGIFRQRNASFNRNRIPGKLRPTHRSYVKAVDWASPGGPASSKKRWSSKDECKTCRTSSPGGPASSKKRWSSKDECKTCRTSDDISDELVPNFGVVAAMSRNRVIGVEGGLPWSLPEDRRHFEDLTRNKALIIGRKTLDEQTDGSHIQHVRKCIVVSTTLAELDSARYDTDKLSLARSFNDALGLACDMIIDMTTESSSDAPNATDNAIDCWVGGGERIFNEALQHPKCREVQLTQVDVDIDFDPAQDVALFPRKYTWDRFYALHDKREGKLSGMENAPRYDFVTHKRKSFL